VRKANKAISPLNPDLQLTHRCKSIILWVLDRLAEIAFAGTADLVENLVQYFASALLPSTKSPDPAKREERVWMRYCQKDVLRELVEWRRVQLGSTVALKAQSTFESVLQFQVLVRQLCNDIRVPKDGNIAKLRIMFAPDARSPPSEIPLNLHGRAGPDAAFPVVDKWCFTCLFSCFSVENVITLVKCLLTSQSVLLLAESLELLAPCAEVGSVPVGRTLPFCSL